MVPATGPVQAPAENTERRHMTDSQKFRPVYGVKDQRWSLLDLLERFADETFVSEGVLRISDLHLRPGKPPHYRLTVSSSRFPEDLIWMTTLSKP